jgi:ankyrin repeat protein
MTALLWACEKGNMATAELLLAKGADMEAKDDVGHE